MCEVARLAISEGPGMRYRKLSCTQCGNDSGFLWGECGYRWNGKWIVVISAGESLCKACDGKRRKGFEMPSLMKLHKVRRQGRNQ